jgi:hypothetical protein
LLRISPPQKITELCTYILLVVFILFLSYIAITCRHTIVFLRQRLPLKHQNVI